MKITKIILSGIIILLLQNTQYVNAQQLNPLKGTWEYQNGNEKFIVSIWEDNEGITKGHYKLVSISNTGENIIYNSKKQFGSSNIDWPYTIYLGTDIFSGIISDNTVNNVRGFIDGQITLTMLQQQCSTCVLTMQWEVKKSQGLREPNEPDFNIPTNITLTKVSNTVNLD